jgi:flagellar biosynthesis component FlhA
MTKVPYAELKERGISYIETTDPLDGSEGAWISSDDASSLKARSWDLSEYIARHLEGVLLRNLVMFNGHMEVRARLLDSWSSQARTILADPTLLTAFTRALHALLSENVPTIDFEVLCEGFMKEWSKTMHLDQTVAALRLLPEIREKLPGTQASIALLKLGRSLEQTLSSSLLAYGDVHILALEPEITQEALSAVRTIYDPERPSAIVCEDAILRPYIRRLVELEFPRLHVVTVSELAPERLTSIEQEIELE